MKIDATAGSAASGPRTFEVHFSRRHIAFAVVLGFIVVGSICVAYTRTLRHAEAKVGELRSVAAGQQERLEKIDSRAAQLDRELRGLARQNQQIEKLLGRRSRPAAHASVPRDDRESSRQGDRFAAVAARLDRLGAASTRLLADEDRLRSLAMRVLNVRRLQDLARARVLAAIPSLNPAGTGVAIRSAFGWRVDPWPEFHAGVDLDADYGDPVRAAAAGTVVAAGYDGGYGYKIDIDHANGYHSWYCHLSRIEVAAGEHVTKAQHIGLVGSSGESTGPHLHYQIVLDGRAVDPAPYLAGVPERVLANLK